MAGSKQGTHNGGDAAALRDSAGRAAALAGNAGAHAAHGTSSLAPSSDMRRHGRRAWLAGLAIASSEGSGCARGQLQVARFFRVSAQRPRQWGRAQPCQCEPHAAPSAAPPSLPHMRDQAPYASSNAPVCVRPRPDMRPLVRTAAGPLSASPCRAWCQCCGHTPAFG
jgi:hypothetical protein